MPTEKFTKLCAISRKLHLIKKTDVFEMII